MIDRVPAIIVHGGAGARPPDGTEEIRAGMKAAVHAGWTILCAAGSALDAVDAAVRILEDHPGFNAGHGAVLTANGFATSMPFMPVAWRSAAVAEALLSV